MWSHVLVAQFLHRLQMKSSSHLKASIMFLIYFKNIFNSRISFNNKLLSGSSAILKSCKRIFPLNSIYFCFHLPTSVPDNMNINMTYTANRVYKLIYITFFWTSLKLKFLNSSYVFYFFNDIMHLLGHVFVSAFRFLAWRSAILQTCVPL